MKTRLHIPAVNFYRDRQIRAEARKHSFMRRTYCPHAFGAQWLPESRGDFADGTRYCCNVRAYFRESGDAHKLTTLRHTGWYVRNDYSDTTRGIVLQLPARKGVAQYVAAYTDPDNDNAASVDLCETYDTPEGAARAADQLAERYAELCRENDAKDCAEQDIESAKEAIAQAREEHSELCAEIRQAQRMQFDLLNPSDIPPARLSQRAPSAICNALRKQLTQLRTHVEKQIKTIRERRDNPWSAIHS